MKKKKSPVVANEKANTGGNNTETTTQSEHIRLVGGKMHVEIEQQAEGGYILRLDNKELVHPTITDLMQSIIEVFQDVNRTNVECTETSALVDTTKRLIEYLLKYQFSPSQVVDVLKHLESAIQRNLSAHKKTDQTTQLQLEYTFADAKEPGFTEARSFSLKPLIPHWLGNSIVRNCNGSIAIQRREIPGVTVFVKKSDVDVLMAQGKRKNYDMLASAGIPEPKRTIVVEYIEDLKDDKLGMFPKTRTATHISSDAGEIDAGLFEKAGW